MALNLCALLIYVPLKAFSGAVLFGLQRLGYSARDLYLPFKVGGNGIGKRVLPSSRFMLLSHVVLGT